MKPFDPTKPVQTRDGRKARIIATDANALQPIIALITVHDGRESVHAYFAEGSWRSNETNSNDLVNTPTKHKREWWVNVYPNGQSEWHTKEEANIARLKHSIACLHIVREFEEGEGL